MTKTELLLDYLSQRGVNISGTAGYRRIRCAFPERHARGDRVPSASVDLGKGRYKCWACDISGDVFDLIHQIEGLNYSQAKTRLGGVAQSIGSSEETWL